MGFPNPFKWVKRTIKKTIKVFKTFVSWLIPQPDIPDFGDSEFDDFEKVFY